MQRLLAATTAVAATIAILVAPAARAVSGCDRSLPAGTGGLPAPVVVRTPCGNYTLRGDGTIDAAPPGPLTRAPVIVREERGHILVFREGRLLWRSRHTFGRRDVPEVVLGTRRLAFALYKGPIWVARLGGREHRIAGSRGELPLGWSRNDRLLTARWGKYLASVWVRRSDGSRPVRLATGVSSPQFDAPSRTLVFVTRGVLVRTNGLGLEPLANLPSLGVPPRSWPDLLPGGLIALRAPDRIVVLGPDGAPVASSLFPDVAHQLGGLFWSTALAADGDRVAFSIVEPDGTNTFGYVSLFVLRAGEDRATRVLRLKIPAPAGAAGSRRALCDGCGWNDTVSWHGNWLLYTAGPEPVLALETVGARRTVDLTDVVAQLPGVGRPADGGLDGVVDVTWSR